MANIRGAITVEENTKELILQKTEQLLKIIMKRNRICNEDIISILFTATQDLTKVYPAVAARQLGIIDASLMCTQEMHVEQSLEKCIRIAMEVKTNKEQKEMRHVYLDGATILRPDLAIKSIAIDGPGGAGKSSVAKFLAEKLNYLYIDTGAMYRSVALYCLENKIDTENEKEVEQALSHIQLDIEHQDGQQKIFLNTEDVTQRVRTQEVGKAASNVAKIKRVRELLVGLQRQLTKSKNIIMDGRDIGTNVLPNASLKIYLDANVALRTKRRVDELIKLGENPIYEKIKAEIEDRDFHDKSREISPLCIAEDAIVIDTSNMSIEQASNHIIELLHEV